MRLIIVLSLVFFVATSLATLLLYDNGQVSMVWGDWVVETSVSFLIAAVLIGFIVVYGLLRLLLNIWHLPLFWRKHRRLRQYSKAETAMAKGMIALEYGDWHKAEKQLIKSAKNSEAGLVHYLSAAKMAHNQKAFGRRDQYINQAREIYPAEYVTIGLVEARLLSEDKPEMSLAILEALYEQQSKNPTILAEYAAGLKKQGYWQTLSEILPDLKKTRALDSLEYAELEQQFWAGKLATAADEAELDSVWQSLSKKQQLIPEILAEYVEQRIGWDQEVTLESLLERAIKKQWNDRLVYQYGRLTLGPAFERLKVAEKWRKTYGDENPVLLLTLGRLACKSQLWALGQGYLKQSLQLRTEVETFHALAQCYEAEGKENQAAITYKEAILQLENK
ncbi:heme biosynthesis HemY N-terminal domain-containing protein [Thiomicrorhabdus lithotrophica]|uniref:Heme biosynthesis protein HemY n=1 Tax=Thiomicrorhabdus lithotrophica TaxID=2949997 RepID=A0ABY8C9Z3_9GAMM|nr:heme biosynthesis HemY N-terminal domain-containing protein [Thiomicrorhabdus lithotrophica]WEJ62798.1 heme biosynthesis protein HemY [Thiomicrorhabdus lithotrophica]